MKQVIRITGKAHQVWFYLNSIARAYGHLTLKEMLALSQSKGWR